MKLESLIYNKDEDSISYIYQDDNDNLYGYSISNNGYISINPNILYEIYNTLKFNDKCTYLTNYNGYNVYYDRRNDLKHFVKDGKEDLELFINFNTSNYVMYAKNKSKNNNSVKMLLIKGSAIIISASMLLSLAKLALNDVNPITAIKYTGSMIVYDIAATFNLNTDSLSEEEAIDLIHASESLPYDLKKKFINYDLFDDIFPYYKNTKMEYIIRNKLTNLTVEEYGSLNPHFYNSSAYYDELEPNVIHFNRITKNEEKYGGHEFVHLLQFPFLEFKYIREATASIINYEYFNENDHKYPEAVENTRLLIDVLGPKVIWQYIFSGDEENLKMQFEMYLEKKDYFKLIKLLSKDPDEKNHDEIRELINKLYFNKYNKDIKTDYDIFDLEGNIILNKVYFNQRIINDQLYHKCSIEEALKVGLINEETYYPKVINESDISNYLDNNDVFFDQRLVGNGCEIINQTADNNVELKFKWYTKTMSREKAFKRNYVRYEHLIYVRESDLDKFKQFMDAELPPIKKMETNSSDISLSRYNPTNEEIVIIRVNNIFERFPNDIINKIEDNQTLVLM